MNVDLRLDTYRASTSLKLLKTNLEMVLGYPFLLRHRPMIDWHACTLLFVRRNRQHLVHGYTGEKLTEDASAAVEAVPAE